jgi:hypothetical protein
MAALILGAERSLSAAAVLAAVQARQPYALLLRERACQR